MKLHESEIKKIAVFRALQLGDMLCAVPAIKSLRYAYPGAKIILLGLPWSESFVRRFDKYFDGFIHFPGYCGLPEQPYNEKKFNYFIDVIRREKFDLVLQMQGNGTIVNEMIEQFGATNMAGFYNDESCVNNEFMIPYPGNGSEILRHLKLMEHMGIALQGSELEFPLTPADEAEFKNLYQEFIQKKYVVVHAGSRQAWRQWPPQFFAALADCCFENGYRVVVTGICDEIHITTELIKCMHHPAINFTGKTSVGGAAALINNASMLVANCTGVSHIAAAFKTPSVIVSMDGEPGRWSPINTELHKVIDCSIQTNFCKVYRETNEHLKFLKKFKTYKAA